MPKRSLCDEHAHSTIQGVRAALKSPIVSNVRNNSKSATGPQKFSAFGLWNCGVWLVLTISPKGNDDKLFNGRHDDGLGFFIVVPVATPRGTSVRM
jgi:hypothetical protein